MSYIKVENFDEMKIAEQSDYGKYEEDRQSSDDRPNFAIVTLQDTDKVTVVASEWLNTDKTQCYWPPFRSAEKLMQAVKNRLEPSTSGKPWELLNILCHAEYDTFEEAVKKQEALIRARKRGQAMYAVVTLSKSNEVMVAASIWLRLDNTRCYWPPFKSAEKCTEAVKNRLDPLDNVKQWEILDITFHGEYATFEQAQKVKEEMKQMERILSSTGTIKRPKFANPVSKNNPPSLPATSRMSTDDKDEMLKLLREIKSKVDENSAMLKKLVKDTPVSDPAPSSTSIHPKDMKQHLNLPLRTTEDVQRTEQMLKNAATRKKYVKYLSDLGGFGPKDVVKNIMQKVLSDDLAKDFNWQGRGDKRPFSRLALADVIKEAASKRNIPPENSETEIKKYLSYTAERIRKRPRDLGSETEISNVICQSILASASQPQYETSVII